MTFLPESPPDAPSTSQPATFQADADAFLAWMAGFATDIEAVGGLLELGAFGLGAIAPPALVDVDDTATATGFYTISNPSAGTVPVLFGFMIVQRRGGASVRQVFAETGLSFRTWTRVYNGSTWSSWSLNYSQGSILGTVSQSGGVPTGAVLESGSNANGEYVRLADGTQFCWHRQGHDGNAWTNANGSLFTATNSSAWSFPAAFSGAPTCHALAERDEMVALGVALRDRNSTSVEYTPWSAVSIGLGNIKAVHIFAVGRWF